MYVLFCELFSIKYHYYDVSETVLWHVLEFIYLFIIINGTLCLANG